MDDFDIFVTGNAPYAYPVDMIFGLLWYTKTEAIEIPKRIPFCGEWGHILSTVLPLRERYPMPDKLNILWISLVEEIVYEMEAYLPRDFMIMKWREKGVCDEQLYSHVVIGMAPLGNVAIWLSGHNKATLISWLKGSAVDANLLSGLVSGFQNIHQFSKHLIKKLNTNQIVFENGLLDIHTFEKRMAQFLYRYTITYRRWENGKWEEYSQNDIIPVIDFIEESLYDGTHDKLHDGGLMKYHQAGKPKKLRVEWHIGKSEYSAYFWFEDERIRVVFDKFHGTHSETKTDFIIRIDAEKRKYELALYRYGLKEPQVIPKDVYQLLVFKNKFEDYRSDNYNQERGAWIW